jgi:hypothetical protein
MFSLYDVRDLDLMLRLDETGGAGGATAQELAEAFGFKREEVLKITTRLTWMRRFGIFDYDAKTHMWTLSESGQRVVKAKLKAASAKAIDTVPDDSLIETMAHVTTRYRLGDPVLATMLRREFAFGTSPRSVIWSAKGGGA